MKLITEPQQNNRNDRLKKDHGAKTKYEAFKKWFQQSYYSCYQHVSKCGIWFEKRLPQKAVVLRSIIRKNIPKYNLSKHYI